MKKVYKLNKLGCANCAAKMGEEIKKMDGVDDAKVNFMLSKLTVEGEKIPSKEELQTVIQKIESYCEIV